MKIAAAINIGRKSAPEGVLASELESPVLEFHAIVERTRAGALVDLLRIKLGFPREVFERAVSPVIEGYAEVAQLLPVPGSQHHAWPGGLFVRGLELASRALDYRRGQILPRGAAPEVIGAQAHRWTYAVFVAALLSGAGRNVPGASERHGVHLLDRFVPPSVRDWLAEAPVLMCELVAFLTGDNSAQTGAISELVLRAARESGSRDLLLAVEVDPPMPPAADSGTANAAQPADVTAATTNTALPDAGTEFLEDVEEEQGEPAERPRTRDPRLAQAPDSAHRFMDWLCNGIADGTIPANQAGAPVHFVDEGMLLVSPRIFQEFAKRFGEDGDSGPTYPSGEADIGMAIQRQFLRAGWHLRADKGVNILTYRVMRGDRPVSRLSGVVIPDPARFIETVPPVNPLLVHSRDERGKASPHGLSA